MLGRHTVLVGRDTELVSSLARVLDGGRGVATPVFQVSDALEALAMVAPANLVVVGHLNRPHHRALPAEVLLAPVRRPSRVILLNAPPRQDIAGWLDALRRADLTPSLYEVNDARQGYQLLYPLLEPARAQPPDPATARRLDALSRPALPHPGLHPQDTPPDVEALNLVVGLWAAHATGTLELPLAGVSARLLGGDPVDDRALMAVVRAMYVGGARFTPGTVPETSSVPLAADLWEAGRRMGRADRPMDGLGSVLYERPAARRLDELPLPDPVVALLGHRGERGSLLALCRSTGVSPSEVSRPLEALIGMGFLGLREPNAPPPPELAEAPSKGSGARLRAPPSLGSRALRGDTQDSSYQLGPFSERFESSGPRPGPRHSVQPSDRWTSRDAPWSEAPRPAQGPPPEVPRPAQRPPLEPPHVRPARPQAPPRSVGPEGPDAPRSVGPSHAVERLLWREKVSNAAPPPPRTRTRSAERVPPRERDDLVIRRLTREWDLLRNANPWVVLGIPEDAGAEMVSRAGARMLPRYEALIADQGYPEEVRELARRVLSRVNEAVTGLTSGSYTSAVAEQLTQHDVAFAQGMRALTDGDYPAACRWFQAARIANPRSAEYTGFLGWAIYKNPKLPAAKRAAKALELLELAEATGERDPRLQVFQATVEVEMGQVDRARKRLEWALTELTDFPEAERLLARLEKLI